MLRELVKKQTRKGRIFKKTMIALFACVVFFVANAALAQPNLGINSLAEGGVQLAQTDIRVIVARIVQVFLGLLGTIAVVLILYGGWLWMTAAGDSTKIATAKKTLINAAIGLLIILSAFSITQFIVSRLIQATSGDFGPDGTGAYGQPLSGSLGAGIISAHVPDRSASAPRNTKVAITFKEAIDNVSLILTSGEANKNIFKMAKTAVLKQAGNNFKKLSVADLVTARVSFTPDKLNFVFSPTALLGSPTEATSYTVFLTSGLKKANGSPAFSGAFSSGYEWEFQVDPIVDTTPPKIASIIPSQGINPRNTIVQINFSEGLDPTSASGDVALGGTGFQNITLASAGNILAGGYKIGNGYKTVEFTTKDACGTNSCGGTIYCLPANATIAAKVLAATLGAEPPQAAGFPYDGIVDLAGNSLDGNGDGKAQGPKSNFVWNSGATALGDNVSWQFNTSSQIDLVPPRISSITPGLSAQNVGLNTPVKAIFNKVMSVITLNNSNLSITHDVPAPYEMFYSVDAEALDAKDQPVAAGANPVKTRAIIKHGAFTPSVLGGTQYNYYPGIKSKIQDLRQNCYNPSSGPSCTPTSALPYCCNGILSAIKCNYVP